MISIPDSPTAADLPAGETNLRVVTLNLFGRQAGWEDRRTVLINGFRELQPDIVAFQEAIVTEDDDQVIDIVGNDYHVIHQSRGLLGDENHGASVAKRWPLGAAHEPDLHVTPLTADYPCGALIVDILAPAPFKPLWFVAHGPSYQWAAEHERELQALATARLVEDSAESGDHVIVAGYFNAEADAASLRFWSGRQSLDGMSVAYQDLWRHTHPDEPGHTVAPDTPLTRNDEPHLTAGRRIDYIFARCGEHGPTLQVRHCERCFDQPVDGVWASDHFGVLADLGAWS